MRTIIATIPITIPNLVISRVSSRFVEIAIAFGGVEMGSSMAQDEARPMAIAPIIKLYPAISVFKPMLIPIGTSSAAVTVLERKFDIISARNAIEKMSRSAVNRFQSIKEIKNLANPV